MGPTSITHAAAYPVLGACLIRPPGAIALSERQRLTMDLRRLQIPRAHTSPFSSLAHTYIYTLLVYSHMVLFPRASVSRCTMAAAPLALPLLLVLAAITTGCGATTVAYNDRAVVIDGQRRIILSGSIHYPRSTPQVRWILLSLV